MNTATLHAERPALTLRFGSALENLSNRNFFELCQANPDLRLERTREGDLVIMSPTGGNTGRRNTMLNYMLMAWAETEDTGFVFDSSTGFTLPNGAVRAPDLSYVRRDRWEALSEEERDMFPPLCPDFVIELRSASDSFSSLREKMREYIANGAHLGWLIDPLEKTVHVYRPGEDVAVLHNPETVSGSPELPGFVLDVHRLW